MNTLNQVRQKVIEAVPENEKQDRIFYKHCGRCECMDDNPNDFVLTLVDVLRAIQECRDELIYVNKYGDLCEFRDHTVKATWNLSANLDEQSPETIEFLVKILCPEQ